MYECPNCGGNLKFDIASQQLACGFCDAKFDPYSVTKEQDAEQQEDYEVTVFRCPQCGGEIYSQDNTAAGFCSFCGASTILSSRLQREKRPDYIIPFKKTKEDCKESYIKMMRRAIFAPKELKKEKYINEFRGIYMPYWVYHIKQQGPVSLPAKKSYRRGDYIITKNFRMNTNLDSYYKGISYDASSSFSDNISDKLGPYDVKNMKGFTPSFLSGFYADTSDVDAEVYQPDAEQTATEQTWEYLNSKRELREFEVSGNVSSVSHLLNTKCEKVEQAMFPVWFMSYRNKGRVAYAAVNGQTGKVIADLPVDLRKYTVASLLLAVPIFLLLCAFVTMTPTILLCIASVLAMLASILYTREIKAIAIREAKTDDRGALWAIHKKNGGTRSRVAKESKKLKSSGDIKNHVVGLIELGVIAVILFTCASSVLGAVGSLSLDGGFTLSIITFIAFIVSGAFFIPAVSVLKQIPEKGGVPGSIWAQLAILLALIITFTNPIHDMFYYGGSAVVLVAVVVTLVDVLKSYNLLSTRRMPQFAYKGGDDRA